MIKTVSPEQLSQWLKNDEVCLIDVREVEEYQAMSIPGAHLIPLGEFSLAKVPSAHAKHLVIHCRSGGRSYKACEKVLAEDPLLDVYNLEGGILAWSEEKFPVVMPKKGA